MAILSRFFNSVGGDRKYKAEDWAAFFGKFIGNGFFAGYLAALQVAPNAEMDVTVRPGSCFINGYMMENTDDYTLTVDTADGVLPRIDRVVVRWSLIDRKITPAIKKGTPASSPVPPELRRDVEEWELSLATIRVNAGVLAISNQDVTDTRLDAAVCGAVTGLIDQIDMTDFAYQYQDMLNELAVNYDSLLGQLQTEYTRLLEQLRQALENVQAGTAWVMKTGDRMTGELTLDVALGIPSGGTGGKTAEEARTNLDVYSKAEVRQLIADIADYDKEVFSWAAEG